MRRRWRLAVVTWVVVYPVITALLFALGPWVDDWALPYRTLALTAIMVPVLTIWLLPVATDLFREFLRAEGQAVTTSCPSPSEAGGGRLPCDERHKPPPTSMSKTAHS